jgi:hypothetical protein
MSVRDGDPNPSAPDLEEVLDNRRWLRRARPFPHVIADRVLRSEYLDAVTAAVTDLIQRGSLGELVRHDIIGTTLTAEVTGPLRFFVSRPWHDLLARVFEIRANGHVNCGVHHHRVGSTNGFPHNDLNPGWFVPEPQDDGIVLPQPRRCSYTDGSTSDPTVNPVESVRGVAAMLYVGNGPWHPGDGGETGLYREGSDPADAPVARVAPIDNRLLAFECTPWSFHGFISNTRRPRNSVIMWLHRSREDVTSRWGDHVVIEHAV